MPVETLPYSKQVSATDNDPRQNVYVRNGWIYVDNVAKGVLDYQGRPLTKATVRIGDGPEDLFTVDLLPNQDAKTTAEQIAILFGSNIEVYTETEPRGATQRAMIQLNPMEAPEQPAPEPVKPLGTIVDNSYFYDAGVSYAVFSYSGIGYVQKGNEIVLTGSLILSTNDDEPGYGADSEPMASLQTGPSQYRNTPLVVGDTALSAAQKIVNNLPGDMQGTVKQEVHNGVVNPQWAKITLSPK
jgi:hypothetical protein